MTPDQTPKSCEWAVDNCHTLARREIRRLERELTKNGGTGSTPVSVAVGAWEHIIRICELTGYRQKGVLREAAQAEPLTDEKWERDTRTQYSQIDLDTATKPLHAEIERLSAALAAQQAALREMEQEMRTRGRFKESWGGSDVVSANVIDEWADDVARLLWAREDQP